MNLPDTHCPYCGDELPSDPHRYVTLSNGKRYHRSCADHGIKDIERSRAAVAAGEPTLSVTLTREEAEYIAAFVSAEDNEPSDDVVTLMVGNGHSGYGLYAVHPEYPEEGAVFVKSLASAPTPEPMSAATEPSDAERCPSCDDTGDLHDQTGEWRGTCKCPAGKTEATNIEAAAKVIAERMDYPWEHMYEKGRNNMRDIARDAIRAAISAKKGGAA